MERLDEFKKEFRQVMKPDLQPLYEDETKQRIYKIEAPCFGWGSVGGLDGLILSH